MSRTPGLALATAVATTLLLAFVSPAGGQTATAGPAPSARGTATGEATTPRCFGAASRDRHRRCLNPALRLSVVPTPLDSLLAEPAVCAGLPATGLLRPCRFGVGLDREPREEIALIGDSHAGHWRAAVRYVAQQRRSRGTGLTRTGCPFTQGDTDLAEPARGRCRRWNDELVAYFRAHPEISTVFVSGRSGVVTSRRTNRARRERGLTFATRVAGREAALRALPASVRHVVVLRDVPRRSLRTLDCVERAMRARRPPGRTCAPPRATVLRPDPAAAAVARIGSRRVRTADLTPFFCTARVCPPVVGGVLVHKDEGHMTTTFAATLGPYLLDWVDSFVSRPVAPPTSGVRR